MVKERQTTLDEFKNNKKEIQITLLNLKNNKNENNMKQKPIYGTDELGQMEIIGFEDINKDKKERQTKITEFEKEDDKNE